MELDTITMDKTEARKAFLDYRAAVRERHDEEDRQMMLAYREISRGRQILRLSGALCRGGTETVIVRDWRSENPRDVRVPRLAVARADADFTWTRGIEMDGSVEIRSKQEVHPNNRRDRIQMPAGTFSESTSRADRNWGVPRIQAIVPTVPPPLRPAHKLSGYHVLWEAEWRITTPPAPADPALLKRISGDLFAVVAIWDLTEVERVVLAGRTIE